MIGLMLRNGGLSRDIFEGQVGKKRRWPRLEYFPQIKKIVCGTLRQVKVLVWDSEWKRMIASN